MDMASNSVSGQLAVKEQAAWVRICIESCAVLNMFAGWTADCKEHKWKSMIKEVDEDFDGKLSFREVPASWP